MSPQKVIFVCLHGIGTSGLLANEFHDYLKLKGSEGRFELFQTSLGHIRETAERKSINWNRGNAVFVTLPSFRLDMEHLVLQGYISPERVVYAEHPYVTGTAQDWLSGKSVLEWGNKIMEKISSIRKIALKRQNAKKQRPSRRNDTRPRRSIRH